MKCLGEIATVIAIELVAECCHVPYIEKAEPIWH